MTSRLATEAGALDPLLVARVRPWTNAGSGDSSEGVSHGPSHVSYEVRNHAELPLVDLKSTPLITLAN